MVRFLLIPLRAVADVRSAAAFASQGAVRTASKRSRAPPPAAARVQAGLTARLATSPPGKRPVAGLRSPRPPRPPLPRQVAATSQSAPHAAATPPSGSGTARSPRVKTFAIQSSPPIALFASAAAATSASANRKWPTTATTSVASPGVPSPSTTYTAACASARSAASARMVSPARRLTRTTLRRSGARRSASLPTRRLTVSSGEPTIRESSQPAAPPNQLSTARAARPFAQLRPSASYASRARSLARLSRRSLCAPLPLTIPPSLFPLPSPLSPLLLSASLTRTHRRYSASDALGAANARDATSAPPPTHLSRPALPGRRSHRCWLRRLRPIPPEPSGRRRLRAPSRSAAHRAPRSPCGGMRPPRRTQAPLKPLSTK